MPDIVVQFTGQELDEMIARAATLSVCKHGFEASACDVVYETYETTSPHAAPWRAKVIVRNTSQR